MNKLDKHLTFLSYQSKVRYKYQDREQIKEACEEVIKILNNKGD